MAPGLDVTWYWVIGLPPLNTGACQLTRARPTPPAAATFVGGSGDVAGVTELDGSDGAPVPTALVAVTVNVYDVPFVRPATIAVNTALVVVAILPSGFAVTVYFVIGPPPRPRPPSTSPSPGRRRGRIRRSKECRVHRSV